MTIYTTNVQVDVRNTNSVGGEAPAAHVINQLLERSGTARGIALDGSGSGSSFPVRVDASDLSDADERLTETFRPRLVDGVDYAISWTLPRAAHGGFFD